MAWMMDTYSMTQGRSVPGVVTGKPLIIGGSHGRREATGRGIVSVLLQSAHHLGHELRGKRVVIQGFGNVGSVVARLLWKDGCVIVGVGDINGGAWNEQGLDVLKLQAHVKESGSVVGVPGAEPISSADLLEQDCDVLVPAAVGSQIHEGNADRVKAAVIVEGANGPTTAEADAILHERGIPVIPDVLANAGGVVVSYFEWVQGLQHHFWRETEVSSRLQEIMTRTADRVWATAEREKVTLRAAALMEGIGRVAAAHRVRGLYP
jgi:glutamate dehydrogenase (NAD(P)+)